LSKSFSLVSLARFPFLFIRFFFILFLSRTSHVLTILTVLARISLSLFPRIVLQNPLACFLVYHSLSHAYRNRK